MENLNTIQVEPEQAKKDSEPLPSDSLDSIVSTTTPTTPTSHKKVILLSVVATIIGAPVLFFGGAFVYGYVTGYVDERRKYAIQKEEVTPFVSEEKDFQITFPGKPMRTNETTPPLNEGEKSISSVYYQTNISTGSFLAYVTSYPSPEYDVSDQDAKVFLTSIVEYVTEGLKVESITHGQVEGFPSVDAFYVDKVDKDEISFRHRFILIGNSLYQTVVSQEKGKTDNSYKAFQDSFKYIGSVIPATTLSKPAQVPSGQDEIERIF